MNLEAEISIPGFIAAVIAMAAFLASAAVLSNSGRVELLFFSSLMMWLSYLAAHKLAEGQLVDGKPLDTDEEKDETMTPETTTEYLGSLSGAAILIAGMVVGAYGIRELNLPLTFVGALIFILGYITAHISTTGELL
ncbi:MAG: hypothetical protein ABEJ36_02095 [Candidatus Nanosalina sp.]